MSLPRKDARPYFDADVYEALEYLAKRDDVTVIAYIERVVTANVLSRVHEAYQIAEATKHLALVPVSARSGKA